MELRKIEEKDKVMVYSYAMFQISEAVVRSQMFLAALKNSAIFHRKTSLLKSLFPKVEELKRSAALLKRDSSTDIFLKNK